MPIYSENFATRDLNVDNVEPSFKQSLQATISRTFEDNSANLHFDKQQIEELNNPYKKETILTDTGTKIVNTPLPVTKLSDTEADAFIAEQGLAGHLKVEGDRYSKAGLAYLIDRHKRYLQNEDIDKRTPYSFSGTPVRLAASFAVGIIDPINAATMFLPIGQAIKPLAMAAKYGETIAGRAAARAGMGAFEGAVTSVPNEIVNMKIKNELHEEYTVLDMMAGVAFGGAFGGGFGALHSGRYKEQRMMFKELQQKNVSLISPESMVKAKEAAGVSTEPYVPKTAEGVAVEITGGNNTLPVEGRHVPFKYEVVDAADLNPATDKAENQARDRKGFSSQRQVDEIANKLDFNLLHQAPTMTDGAPVLSKDGAIIAGNGRTLGIKQAYATGKGQSYKGPLLEKLKDMGIPASSIKGMKDPVLVRRLSEDVDIRKAAVESNERGSMRMSALENAQVDAERVDLTHFTATDDGELNVPTNRDAISKWIDSYPVEQQPALRDVDGLLSSEGATRLKNAVLFKAYGDSPVLRGLVDSADTDNRNIANALVRVAPRVAEAKATIARGALHDLDISRDVEMAVTKFEELKSQGFKVSDYFKQVQFFDDGMEPTSKQILQFIGENSRSPRKLSEALSNYYSELDKLGDPRQGAMFEAMMTSKQDLFLKAIKDIDDRAYELIDAAHPETRKEAFATSLGTMIQDHRPIAAEPIIRADSRVGGATREDITDGLNESAKQENSFTGDDLEGLKAVNERVAEKAKDIPTNYENSGLIKGNEALAKDIDYMETKLKAGIYYSRKAGEKVNQPVVSKMETPQFKKWFGKSKVIDKDGKPLVMYHGTEADFNVFTYEHLGKTGSVHGYGHYFTGDKSLAEQFGELHTVYLSIQKPLMSDKKTITKPELSKFIKELDPDGEGFLSNYGDINRMGYDKLVNEVVKSLYEHNNNDADIISNIIIDNGGKYSDIESLYNTLKDTTGYDGIVDKNLYIAFKSNQIKSINNTGTFDLKNPDIRYSNGHSASTPREVLIDALAKSFGDDTQKLMHSGMVDAVSSVSELPQYEGVKHFSDTKAMFDGKKVYVVADNLTPAEAKGILLHEVGVHANLENWLGTDFYNQAIKDIHSLLDNDDPAVVWARSQVPDETNPAHVDQEIMAYLVEKNPELPLVQKIMSKIKTWILQKFPALQGKWKLNADDFTTLATASLRAYARDSKLHAMDLKYSVANNVPELHKLIEDSKPIRVSNDIKEVDRILRPLVNREIINKDNNMPAKLSNNSVDKITSGSARRKSAFGTHEIAAVNIDNLYENAIYGWTYADKKPGSIKHIENMHRFFAPIAVNNKIYLTKIAVKEFKNPTDGTRIYTIESIDIDENTPALKSIATLMQYDNIDPDSHGQSKGKVVTLAERIQKVNSDPKVMYSRGINAEQHLEQFQKEIDAWSVIVAKVESFDSAIKASFDFVGNSEAMAINMSRHIDMEGINSELFNMDDLKEMAKTVYRAYDSNLRRGMDSIKAYDVATTKGIETFKRAALEQKKNAIDTAMKRGRMMRDAELNPNKVKYLKSLILGNSVTTENSRAHTAARIAGAMQLQAEGAFMADLEQHQLVDWYRHNVQWQDTIKAMEALEFKKDTSKFAPESVKLAELIGKHYDNGLLALSEAGASVNKFRRYYMNNRNAHNQTRIHAVGEAAWVKDGRELFDLKTMADNMSITEAEVIALLPTMHKEFSSGLHELTGDTEFKLSEAEEAAKLFLPGSKTPNRIGNRVNKSRVILFKDADAFTKYFEKYGSGNFASSVHGTIGNTSHYAGLIKSLGVKHRENVHWITDKLIKDAKNPEEADALRKFKADIDTQVDFLDGSANQVGNVKAARVMGILRTGLRMAQLGLAVFSQFSDLATVGAHMNTYGKSYLSTIPNVLSKIFLPNMIEKDKKHIITNLGVFNRSMIAEAYHLTGEFDNVTGALSKMQNIFFKANLQNWATYRTKMAASDCFLNHMGQAAADSYADLDINIKHQLTGYGIKEKDWELLRQSSKKMKDGNTYLDGSGLDSIRDSILQHVVDTHKINDVTIANRLTDDYTKSLRDNYRQFVMDGIGRMIMEPSARAQYTARMGSNAKAGTWSGEFFRAFAMYKTFNIELIQNTLSHALYDNKKGTASVVMGMAKYALTAIATGYMAMTLKDMAKGLIPRPADDYRTWMAAALQGGAVPILGDFLFGENSRFGNSSIASAIGPMSGLVENGIKIFSGIASLPSAKNSTERKQKITQTFNTAVNTVLNSTPGINLFYIRAVLNYLFLYNLQEWMRPGSLAKMQQTARDDRGQRYYMPPSKFRLGQ